jgi:hypothetical protein
MYLPTKDAQFDKKMGMYTTSTFSLHAFLLNTSKFSLQDRNKEEK